MIKEEEILSLGFKTDIPETKVIKWEWKLNKKDNVYIKHMNQYYVPVEPIYKDAPEKGYRYAYRVDNIELLDIFIIINYTTKLVSLQAVGKLKNTKEKDNYAIKQDYYMSKEDLKKYFNDWLVPNNKAFND